MVERCSSRHSLSFVGALLLATALPRRDVVVAADRSGDANSRVHRSAASPCKPWLAACAGGGLRVGPQAVAARQQPVADGHDDGDPGSGHGLAALNPTCSRMSAADLAIAAASVSRTSSRLVRAGQLEREAQGMLRRVHGVGHRAGPIGDQSHYAPGGCGGWRALRPPVPYAASVYTASARVPPCGSDRLRNVSTETFTGTRSPAAGAPVRHGRAAPPSTAGAARPAAPPPPRGGCG